MIYFDFSYENCILHSIIFHNGQKYAIKKSIILTQAIHLELCENEKILLLSNF